MNSFPFTLEQIMAAMEAKKYKVFAQEYDLNIVGIRTKDTSINQFNDWICVFHKRPLDYWPFYAFQATTDPGTYWRKNPMMVEGTAWLVPDQYRSMWRLGKHKDYDALQQNTPVRVFRDADRDNDLDEGRVQEGMFGINCHRANKAYASRQVEKWSAGCQVFADPMDFAFFLSLCRKQEEVHGWSTYTYTLLTQTEVEMV